MEREKAVTFDALAAMPNTFLRPSVGRLMPGFFTAAFASAAAAFSARLACRSARTLSAARSASRIARADRLRLLEIAPDAIRASDAV